MRGAHGTLEVFRSLAFPPILRREDLDFDWPRIAPRSDKTSDHRNVDDAITHHAAVIEDVIGWNQPSQTWNPKIRLVLPAHSMSRRRFGSHHR